MIEADNDGRVIGGWRHIFNNINSNEVFAVALMCALLNKGVITLQEMAEGLRTVLKEHETITEAQREEFRKVLLEEDENLAAQIKNSLLEDWMIWFYEAADKED